MNQRPAIQPTFAALRVLNEPLPSEPLETDAELLSVYLATGNRVPMEMLMRRHSSMVASVCRSTVSDPGAAEDAYQATFLIFLRSAKRIRKRASVGAWLHGVAYRTACRLRQQRRVQRRKCLSLDTQHEIASKQIDPLAQIARQMELEVLDQELQILPRNLRDPLVEHFLLGFSATKIAERMDLSTSAVEGRIRRGRLKLRSRLARRGVSLTVAVAAAGWCHDQVQAAETDLWFSDLLHGTLAQWSTGSSVPSSPKLEVSSLVNGELNMFNATAFNTTGMKFVVAASLAIGLGAVIAFNPLGFGVSANAAPDDAQGVVALQADPAVEQSSVLAQISPTKEIDPFGDATSNTLAQRVSAQDTSKIKPTSVAWSRPEGSDPDWFKSGAEHQAGVEANRKNLRQKISMNYNSTPLRQVLQQFMDDYSLAFYINLTEIDALGADVDAPISLEIPQLSLREALNLLLKPQDLTYKIHESYIEITSQDNAKQEPGTRFYDLSHVLPGPAAAESLVMAIQNSCSPDSWLQAGGRGAISVVGSLMIVSCPEETHFQIEGILANVGKVSPANLESTLLRNPQHPGGMGGGGIGGQGGMF